ncbi:pre-mRNA-processing ATP-dependent RNA helicase prp11-like isoform X1 [Sipha flava]|uniref:ATP-dependent RNA helicase n=2 Tax=Sipha flava TaxID=143950 RepID=A0A8B8FGT9_9HEMI|nr:pre-mRNA-processing ATP-dependent RNA helicase prp11-like isoform X1 [Sipha flava]
MILDRIRIEFISVRRRNVKLSKIHKQINTMSSEIEKYVIKQNQLQNQIDELFAEKKVLQNKIDLLNECLSFDKIKRKISELENKQKILTSLESIINNLKNEIKPLEYLKHILHRQLMVSTLTSNDLDTQEQKNSENSQLTANSGCAIETLDSLSDISSEDSVMVLSEYEVVSDEDVISDMEKSVSNKVMYDEALQMASSMHSSLFESLTKNTESIATLSNVSDLMQDVSCVQPNLNDIVGTMSTSNKSEELLKMYDVVKDKNLLNCGKNDEVELKHNAEYVKSIAPGANQVTLSDKGSSDRHNSLNNKEHNMLKSSNDSWVKVNENGLLDIALKNEPTVDIIQEIIEDNTLSQGNIEIHTHRQNNKLANRSKDEIEILPFKLNTEDISREYNKQKEKIEIDAHKQNCQLTNVLKDSNEFTPLILNTGLISNEYNEQKNILVETHVENNKQLDQKFESKEDSSVNKNFENICYCMEYNYGNEIHNPICLTNNSKDEINSLMLNIEVSSVMKKCNDLSVNGDKPSPFNNDEKSLQPCHIDKCSIMDLNIELSNGIRDHGFENFMTLQQQFLFHCINGRDIIFHSYPCIGKSTICFISVLQKINTSLNECQAIILVPTLELALCGLKMIKSFGKFLNVSTCIGGSNVPRKVSPVPHVVISTPHGLCDMINCNSLCKDFIKILVVDDADEMFNYNGFFNNIRRVLLFLNNNPQLIVLSTSKLEEIFDQFSEVMQNPEYIIVPDEKPSLEDILQYCVNVPEEWKFDALYELYETLNLMRTVVYCKTWSKSLEVAVNLRLKSCTVSAVHQEMDTRDRKFIIQKFRSDLCKLLITTELLKGEDFSAVLWIVNYDLPTNSKDYVRRIVGCFNRRVRVINFITKNDSIAKKNIETSFNMCMLNFPQNVTDLCIPDLGSVNDSSLN